MPAGPAAGGQERVVTQTGVTNTAKDIAAAKLVTSDFPQNDKIFGNYNAHRERGRAKNLIGKQIINNSINNIILWIFSFF